MGEAAKMKSCNSKDDVRWQVVKAMLDEFPTLRRKVEKYIEKEQT
jgi:hypothetical protein